MAPPIRRADPAVADELFAEPYRFDFFQAVRLLERLARDREPVGRAGPPMREAARFRAHSSLSFPPSSIRALSRPGDDARPPDMTVAFLGLIGPSGVLPHVYTELVIDRLRAGDRALAAFLDLFGHRMVSLFFRAWEKNRPAIAFERGDAADPLAELAYAFIGLGLPSLRSRLDVPDVALLPYAGLLAQRHRPAGSLEAMLSDYFGRPIAVEPFVGRWLKLEPGDRSALGASGPHNGLGSSLVVGSKIWDEQSKFRLRIGPLTLEQYRQFLPGGAPFRALCRLARLYADAEFDFDVQLILKADEVPPPHLSGDGPQLGRTLWSRAGAMPRDADDGIFPAEA